MRLPFLTKCVVPLVVLFSAPAFAAAGKQMQIRIDVPDRETLNRVWSSGIDFEGTSGKPGGMMDFFAGERELRGLSAMGIRYEVLIDDVAAYYARGLAAGPVNALGFGYGSMGGYYTYAEVLRQLDTMRLQYPSLISQRDSIGRTAEGRALWTVKISDNPAINEPEEPEVLYTALHHAREPEGMMTLLYYMWWLLENYSSNPEASYLVNNRQMWFIPVVNPDGYVYNQTTYPGGGGMWRKNRSLNSGSYGVDLNRNYGPSVMWNAPNGGSSTYPPDDTYRGPSAFSEYEIHAIDLFMRAHQFKTCLNYHTYGNYLVYPWGYLSQESGDSLTYREWAYEMTFDNHFTSGTDQQTVAYSTRGGSDDYMFGDTTKPVTYSVTPEVGITGFWPSTGEILPLATQNLRQNILFSRVAGQYTALRSYRIQDAGGNGFPDRGESFDILATVRNRGLGSAMNLTVTITSGSTSVQFAAYTITLGTLTARHDTLLRFSGSVNPAAVTGIPVQAYFSFFDPEGFQRVDTIQFFLGTPTLLFADSASGGTTNWTTGQGWGVTSNAHTPPQAFTDSPAGNYLADADNSLALNSQINLTGYNYAQLLFWTKWAIEPTWDFATVELSTNNGSTWAALRTGLSHSGSGRSGSRQPTGTWGYESYTPGLTWMEQGADLSAYINRQVKIRFRLAADGGEQRDGFSVDDVRVYGYTINSTPVPAAPVLLSPVDGAANQSTSLVFVWRAVLPAERYRIQISSDSLFPYCVVDDSTVTDTVRLITSLPSGTMLWWRVGAENVAGMGSWSAVRRFTTAAGLSRRYAMVSGWNMLSVPLAASDMRKATLYPSATSPAYAFDPGQGYVLRDTLDNGSGYWVKFDSAQLVLITGFSIPCDTIDLEPGWGLIGGISDAVDTAAVVQDPPGILCSAYYGFNGAYVPADSLMPGASYWVKATGPGHLILTTPAGRAQKSAAASGRPIWKTEPRQQPRTLTR